MNVRVSLLVAALFLLSMSPVGHAEQEPEIGVPVPPLGDGPWVFDTAEQHKIRVSVVAKGNLASMGYYLPAKRRHVGHRTRRSSPSRSRRNA
ncbi:MAG: hypothetical protein Ct9H300mP25_11750 [Acidobacteriota bacterium]|nr:MAG: hypothetical protein Ct9H300mP25_11750 [Acidobacteriota bacterium]